MRPPVIYLNELSWAFEGDIDLLRSHVVRAISALVQVARLRRDVRVRVHCPLSEITFGSNCLSLGSVFRGLDDHFNRLKLLLDRNPCGVTPSPSFEVRCEGQLGIGLSWADHDESFVLSFGHMQPWSQQLIPAQRITLDALGALQTAPVTICNLAAVEHSTAWQTRLRDFGCDVARSSLLYQGTHFVIRMHLNDHGYPHVHIYPRLGDTHDLIAKVRVDNGDVLEGGMSSPVRHEVMRFIESNRDVLLRSWERCRAGQLPIAMES